MTPKPVLAIALKMSVAQSGQTVKNIVTDDHNCQA